jgi:hypothetical protein
VHKAVIGMSGPMEAPFGFAFLRRAMEAADVATILTCYADDVLLTVISADPSIPPFQLAGVAELAKHFRAVFFRPAVRTLARPIFQANEVRFIEDCRYADGGRVRVETTLQLANGLITKQTDRVGILYSGDVSANTG